MTRQQSETDEHNENASGKTMFHKVFSSVLGAVIGSAPGALMEIALKENSRLRRFSGHIMMIGGMIGAMLGHDHAGSKSKHVERLQAEEKTTRSNER